MVPAFSLHRLLGEVARARRLHSRCCVFATAAPHCVRTPYFPRRTLHSLHRARHTRSGASRRSNASAPAWCATAPSELAPRRSWHMSKTEQLVHADQHIREALNAWAAIALDGVQHAVLHGMHEPDMTQPALQAHPPPHHDVAGLRHIPAARRVRPTLLLE